MTIKVRIVAAEHHGQTATDIPSKMYLKQEVKLQDYCLVFDTPSAHLDEVATFIDAEYGKDSAAYARNVKEVKIHAYTPRFMMSEDKRLKEYTGTGVDVVKTPASVFYIDKDHKFTFSDNYHAGGAFFAKDLKPLIMMDLSRAQEILSKSGVTLEISDETQPSYVKSM